jgi:hypothetical protein
MYDYDDDDEHGDNNGQRESILEWHLEDQH